jgi:hypothetical protein
MFLKDEQTTRKHFFPAMFRFIYIMDVELDISSRFSILFEICIMIKETNNE